MSVARLVEKAEMVRRERLTIVPTGRCARITQQELDDADPDLADNRRRGEILALFAEFDDRSERGTFCDGFGVVQGAARAPAMIARIKSLTRYLRTRKSTKPYQPRQPLSPAERKERKRAYFRSWYRANAQRMAEQRRPKKEKRAAYDKARRTGPAREEILRKKRTYAKAHRKAETARWQAWYAKNREKKRDYDCRRRGGQAGKRAP